jgi:hypothetical protein
LPRHTALCLFPAVLLRDAFCVTPRGEQRRVGNQKPPARAGCSTTRARSSSGCSPSRTTAASPACAPTGRSISRAPAGSSSLSWATARSTSCRSAPRRLAAAAAAAAARRAPPLSRSTIQIQGAGAARGISYQADFRTEPGVWAAEQIPFARFRPTVRGRPVPDAPAMDGDSGARGSRSPSVCVCVCVCVCDVGLRAALRCRGLTCCAPRSRRAGPDDIQVHGRRWGQHCVQAGTVPPRGQVVACILSSSRWRPARWCLGRAREVQRVPPRWARLLQRVMSGLPSATFMRAGGMYSTHHLLPSQQPCSAVCRWIAARASCNSQLAARELAVLAISLVEPLLTHVEVEALLSSRPKSHRPPTHTPLPRSS